MVREHAIWPESLKVTETWVIPTTWSKLVKGAESVAVWVTVADGVVQPPAPAHLPACPLTHWQGWKSPSEIVVLSASPHSFICFCVTVSLSLFPVKCLFSLGAFQIFLSIAGFGQFGFFGVVFFMSMTLSFCLDLGVKVFMKIGKLGDIISSSIFPDLPFHSHWCHYL